MILYNVDETLAHSVRFSTKAFLSSKLGVEAVLIANTNIRFVAFFVKTDANLACHDHTVGCPKSLKHSALWKKKTWRRNKLECEKVSGLPSEVVLVLIY